MSFRIKFFVILLLSLFVVVPMENAHCAEQNSLINIQQKFAASIKPQFEAYYLELSVLEKSLAAQAGSPGLTKVRNELQKVEGQLKGITTLINFQPGSAPTPTAQPIPVAKPKPVSKPNPTVAHKPKTHINSTKGIAGSPKFSKNNTYSFNLTATGNNSSLVFYATGRRSTDTKGQVWLIKPDGKKLKVTKWKEKNFTYPSKEIKSYTKLDPITEDISALVDAPGLYKVIFEWTGGIDPLVIYRVELTS